MTATPLLFNLAVLYRALAFRTDGVLAPAEAEAVREALAVWAPEADPARLDHVLRQVALADVGPLALGEVVAHVGAALPAQDRARVLADLRRIAEADGRVTTAERDLLALVERVISG